MKRSFAMWFMVLACVATAVLAGGCSPLATQLDVADGTLRLTRQVQQAKLELGDQHAALGAGGDVESLRRLVEDGRRQSEVAVAQAAAAADEARQAGLEVKDLAGTALVAGDLVTGGRVSLLLDAASNRAVREIAGVRQAIDEQANSAAAKWHETIADARQSINDRIDQWIEKINSVQSRVEVLDATTQSKLSMLELDAVQRMAALLDDDAAFRAYVRDAARLSPEEVAQLDGMTPEQILSLVLASTAAAGVGGALGRTGKSRAQSQIDALKAKMQA